MCGESDDPTLKRKRISKEAMEGRHSPQAQLSPPDTKKDLGSFMLVTSISDEMDAFAASCLLVIAISHSLTCPKSGNRASVRRILSSLSRYAPYFTSGE